MPDGIIAPHCKQVLFTGCFCAADASTPARRERHEDSTWNLFTPIKKKHCFESDSSKFCVRTRRSGRITRTSVQQTYHDYAQCGDPMPPQQSKRTANVPIQPTRVMKETTSP